MVVSKEKKTRKITFMVRTTTQGILKKQRSSLSGRNRDKSEIFFFFWKSKENGDYF